MSDIQLVFAVRKDGDDIRLYSCRYFGATTFKCAHWKFQRTNMALEKLGKVEVMPYQYAKGPGAPAQLAAHLGDDWQTLQNLETFNTVLRGMQPETSAAKPTNLRLGVSFVGDNCQYFPGAPSREGWEGAFVGTGNNESEAFEHAINWACECCTDKSVLELLENVENVGNAENDMALYFGPDVDLENTDLQIFCTIYYKLEQ